MARPGCMLGSEAGPVTCFVAITPATVVVQPRIWLCGGAGFCKCAMRALRDSWQGVLP